MPWCFLKKAILPTFHMCCALRFTVRKEVAVALVCKVRVAFEMMRRNKPECFTQIVLSKTAQLLQQEIKAHLAGKAIFAIFWVYVVAAEFVQ